MAKSRIGIPYAHWDLSEERPPVRVCPVCGERIPEEPDEYGETISNNYGEHYMREHGEEGSED